MQVDGLKTYWGQDVDKDLDENLQRLIGVNKQLTKPGKDADETEARQKALGILDEPEKGKEECTADHDDASAGACEGSQP